MKITKIIGTLRKSISFILNFSKFKILLNNLLKIENHVYSDNIHLKAAIEWLTRAQDITKCGGVSAGYSLETGWDPPYPETTGYIIPTFLQYAYFINDPSYIKRAEMMGNWEIKIQLPSGAIRGGIGKENKPKVFNTGQVILGWIALFEETKKEKFLKAAIKAANWLEEIQDSDGKWSKKVYLGIPHSYNTRVAWSLLEVFKHTNDEKYKQASERNILWVFSHAKKNGWLENMGFYKDLPPLTHTIGYTLRGLLESSFYLSDNIKQNALKIVCKAAENIMMRYELKNKHHYTKPSFLPATFYPNWNSNDKYSCLTGNAQIAIIWLKLFLLKNDIRFFYAALKIIEQIKITQLIASKDLGIKGGIAGSYPIWGEYMTFYYPNWATKFYCDALILKNKIIYANEENFGKII